MRSFFLLRYFVAGVILFSCQKKSLVDISENNPPLPSTAIESPEVQVDLNPVVFANYDQIILVSDYVLPSSESCKKSKLFQSADICSTAVSSIEHNISTEQSVQTTWVLPKTPQFLYWQQTLAKEQNLVVELIDSDGLPWPSSSLILYDQNNQFTIQMELTYELPTKRDLFLTGSIFDLEGQKQNTWFVPLSVADGGKNDAIWAYKPPASTVKSLKRKRAKKSKR